MFQFNCLCDQLKRRKNCHCQSISSADRVCVQKLFSMFTVTEGLYKLSENTEICSFFFVVARKWTKFILARTFHTVRQTQVWLEEDVFLLFANAEEMRGKKMFDHSTLPELSRTSAVSWFTTEAGTGQREALFLFQAVGQLFWRPWPSDPTLHSACRHAQNADVYWGEISGDPANISFWELTEQCSH